MSLTFIITLLTVLVSLLGFQRQEFFHLLKHNPWMEGNRNQWYRLLSCGFLHANWLHLLVNMFVLYQFGAIVESSFHAGIGKQAGTLAYLFFYLSSIIVGALPTYFQHRDHPGFSSIGASGAVSAILSAYAVMYPWQMIYLYGILPIPGIISVALFLWYSSYASRHSRDMVDHQAHFYGAAYGLIFPLLLDPRFLSHFLEQLLHPQF